MGVGRSILNIKLLIFNFLLVYLCPNKALYPHFVTHVTLTINFVNPSVYYKIFSVNVILSH